MWLLDKSRKDRAHDIQRHVQLVCKLVITSRAAMRLIIVALPRMAVTQNLGDAGANYEYYTGSMNDDTMSWSQSLWQSRSLKAYESVNARISYAVACAWAVRMPSCTPTRCTCVSTPSRNGSRRFGPGWISRRTYGPRQKALGKIAD